MRLIDKCPVCSKPLILVEDQTFGTLDLKTYKCGHFFTDEQLKIDEAQLIAASVDGTKSLRPYQLDGVKFIIESGFNCIIGDQMRLGKTPQALMALANVPERLPALGIVRSANLYQWLREYKVWTDDLPLGVFPILGTKSFIPQGFSFYLISMDTFARKGMSDILLKFGFKACIVDEMHSFKNTDSKRSQALIAFLKSINIADITHEVPFTCMICKHSWIETVTVKQDSMDAEQRVSKSSYCEKCNALVNQTAAAHVKVSRKCGFIGLSGTSIKNRADELFVPLNIVAPSEFPSLERFRRNWLEQDQKGKWSRVNRYALDAFRTKVSKYMLRREKEDVFTELPKLNRMFTVIELDDENLKKAYNKVLDTIEQNLERGNYKYFDNIGEITLLRQICGMAKVNWTADYVEASLLDSDNKKIAVGVHHHAVRDGIAYKLAQFGVVKYSDESLAHKNRVEAGLATMNERILVVSELAGGVGCDFHAIDDIIILERQFTSTDEEQFEFRFYNPDIKIKNRPTNVEYIVCKNTIDEWLYDLIEGKREIVGETIGNHWSLQDNPQMFKQLLETTVSHRL